MYELPTLVVTSSIRSQPTTGTQLAYPDAIAWAAASTAEPPVAPPVLISTFPSGSNPR